MRELLRGLLDLLAPPACARCRGATKPDAVLCRGCAASLARIPEGACPRCQERPASDTGCAVCRAGRSWLDACVASVWFEGEVRELIRRFKYPAAGLGGLESAPQAVACSLVREAVLRAPGPRPDRVVPVPLHRRALRRRGFNPAGVLARTAARASGGRIAPLALERIRDTPSQTGFDRAGRRRNVRGAFRARGAQSGCIWLVDDVVTTGATLEEAARALRGAGATSVLAVCAARTPVRTATL